MDVPGQKRRAGGRQIRLPKTCVVGKPVRVITPQSHGAKKSL